ncbi:MAG TPA: zf-HC2 domain-containing protein, partial [Acinetobacter sp.]|nr:zf-HC2 domain-containing protein [Acinetobacter sp.]
EQSGLQFHLMLCRSCRRFGKQMKTISELSKAYKKIDVDDNHQK